jgi:TIR domain
VTRETLETVSGQAFISYSRGDQAYVDRLVAELRTRGADVWIDRETNYGARWGSVIEKQIKSCAVLIVVMTPHSRESEWVENEILYAKKLHKVIFPLVLEGELWWDFGNAQAEIVTDYRLPSDRFIASVLKLCGQKPPTPPPDFDAFLKRVRSAEPKVKSPSHPRPSAKPKPASRARSKSSRAGAVGTGKSKNKSEESVPSAPEPVLSERTRIGQVSLLAASEGFIVLGTERAPLLRNGFKPYRGVYDVVKEVSNHGTMLRLEHLSDQLILLGPATLEPPLQTSLQTGTVEPKTRRLKVRGVLGLKTHELELESIAGQGDVLREIYLHVK